MTDVMKFTKQAFTWSVVAMTIVWSLGLATLAPVAANAATCATLEAGDLVKFGTQPAVYVVDEAGALHTFTTPEQLNSWGYTYDDVHVETDVACINNYSNPSTMAGRGFSYGVVKPEIGATVYLLALDGAMYSIPTAADATALWGESWGSLMRGIPPFLASNYRIAGATPLDINNLPNEVLLSYNGSYYVLRAGELREVAGTVNAFMAARAIQATDAMIAQYGPISGSSASASGLASVLRDFAGSSNGPGPVQQGMLTVGVSAMSATDIAPVGARLDVLTLNFTAGSSAVTINGITLTKSGLMSKDDLKDVGIFVGNTRYGNERSSFNSDNKMNFNFPTPITVAANQTVTVEVRGRVASSTGSFIGLLVQSASDISSSAASVSGSFPMAGSYISIASGVSAGKLVVMNVDGNDDDAKFGDDDVTLADFVLDNDSDEAIIMNSLVFENDGRGTLSDLLENVRVLIDGDVVSEHGAIEGDHVTFMLDGFEIEDGKSVNVEVLGDIGAGEEGDTIELFLDAVEAFGKNLGFRVSLNNDTFDKGSKGMTITISGGDVTMNFNRSADHGTPRKEVRPDTDNVVIATLELTSEAEDLEIFSIGDVNSDHFYITGLSDVDYLEDIQLRQVGGGTYDVTKDDALVGGNLRLEITDDMYLNAGQTYVFELIADIADDASGEFEVILNEDAFDYEGVTSESTDLDFVPAEVRSAVVEIEQASVDIINVQLTNVTAVEGATNVVVYNGRLKASTASDLRVNSLKLTAGGTTALFSNANITNLTLKFLDGSTVVETKSFSGSSISSGAINFNSLNVTIPAGKQYTVEVVANFATNFSATGTFGLRIAAVGDVSVRTINSGTTYTLKASDKEFLGGSQSTLSRNVTLAAEGTISVDLQVDDSNWNSNLYVLAGATTPAERYLAEVAFETQDESFELRELTVVAAGTATIADIDRLRLVSSNGTVVAETDFEGVTTTFKNLSVPFAQDEISSLYLTFVANSINAAGDASGTATEAKTASFKLAAATVYGEQSRKEVDLTAGGSTPAAGEVDTNDSSKTATIVGTRLNSVVNNILSTQALIDGANRVIGEYVFTFESGSNRYSATSTNGVTTTINGAHKANLQQLILELSGSNVSTTENIQVYVKGDPSKKTVAGVDVVGGNGTATIDLTPLGEVSGTVTLVVEADVTFAATGSVSLSTQIADLSTDFSFNGYSDALLKYADVSGAYYANNR